MGQIHAEGYLGKGRKKPMAKNVLGWIMFAAEERTEAA
jgi:hypothetical protein